MAKKTFKTNLSISGIRNLQKQLADYRDSLPQKCKELTERLKDIGINVIEAKVGQSPLGKYVTVKTDMSEEEAGYKAILIATGAVKESEGYAPFNTLLAIEFGAGIHYNKEENPKAPELGFGVGTFPGQIHAFEDGWYYWDDKAQKWRYTHGVKATMPMYSASVEIQQNIVKVAKEIFK